MAIAPLAIVALALAGSTPPDGAHHAAPASSLRARWPGARASALADALAPGAARPDPERKAWSCPIEFCPPPSPVGLAHPLPRPKKTEIFLALVARSGVEPVATVAAYLAIFPLRVQWSPPTVEEQAGLVPGASRFGHLDLVLRWRIDATNRPVTTLPR